MVPEHLLGKSVLKMSAVELQESSVPNSPRIRPWHSRRSARARSADRNWPVKSAPCADTEPLTMPRTWIRTPMTGMTTDGSCPSARTMIQWTPSRLWPHPSRLKTISKEQIRSEFTEDTAEIAEFIVDALDDDGYLREPLIDMANRLRMSVPELEVVLRKVQSLDPPGSPPEACRNASSYRSGRSSGRAGTRIWPRQSSAITGKVSSA